VAAALHRIRRGEPVVVFGDGGNVRDYVYAPDIAAAMIDLAGLDGGAPVVNVGSGEGVSLTELLAVIGRVTGIDPVVERRPDRGFDVRANVLDNALLRELVDPAFTPLEEGLAATWAARG
jgi:UDP-glucose 4-epimerase